MSDAITRHAEPGERGRAHISWGCCSVADAPRCCRPSIRWELSFLGDATGDTFASNAEWNGSDVPPAEA